MIGKITQVTNKVGMGETWIEFTSFDNKRKICVPMSRILHIEDLPNGTAENTPPFTHVCVEWGKQTLSIYAIEPYADVLEMLRSSGHEVWQWTPAENTPFPEIVKEAVKAAVSNAEDQPIECMICYNEEGSFACVRPAHKAQEPIQTTLIPVISNTKKMEMPESRGQGTLPGDDPWGTIHRNK